jgi:hypothetical protein
LVAKPEADFVLQMAFPGPAPRVSVTNPQSHFLPDWVLMVVDFTVVRDPTARGWDHDLLDRPLRLEVLSLLTCRTEP